MNTITIFDSHLHIIAPGFPLVPNNGYVPDAFTCADYRARVKDYHLLGGALVSGSFQAFDQTWLLAALQQLGPSFVGVTQLPASVSDEQVIALHTAGVRALRFNLKRGGSADVDQLERMAHRVYELVGWHVELYVDSAELSGLFNTLLGLPSVSIDHLGLSKRGFPTLVKLAERGVRVKATGFGRTDFDVRDALSTLYSANPDTLMFGTDLPSTRAPRPFQDEDIDLIIHAVGEEGAQKVLYKNALAFYRLSEDADQAVGFRKTQ
ncbi:amidohydrolase family protein [Cellvibrio sp. ARAG 10.3]|uniref:amidohydrolase family protein n=1 Tax=Cellvibrio sp. ARAG 10.3 TaxID=3451358 RepID=UPI003F479BD9